MLLQSFSHCSLFNGDVKKTAVSSFLVRELSGDEVPGESNKAYIRHIPIHIYMYIYICIYIY